MNLAALSIYWTARGAFVGYSLTLGLLALADRRPTLRSAARTAWTIGCAIFLVHVFCVFQFHHHWSHQAAFEEVRQRTIEFSGVDSGFGIYLNYLFTVLWVVDVFLWRTTEYGRSTAWWFWLLPLHAFLLFMFFNGTVVFAIGAPMRWFSIAVFALLTYLWSARILRGLGRIRQRATLSQAMG